ncbi:MAG: C40 family peptidase [Verrucomicrobiales bacterium]|nr:C40 family peptidase [Verrucomicrobiales bacterium]
MPSPTRIVCNYCCVPMRLLPDVTSEKTSQVLFGEGGEILETDGHLCRVRLDYDGYEGWVDGRQLVETSTGPEEETAWVGDVCAPATGAGRKLHLVLGSPLPRFTRSKFEIAGESYAFSGTVIRRPAKPPTASRVLSQALRYLDTPYLWGGRTPFGLDCSGLVQMALRVFGIGLPRDSIDQKQQSGLLPVPFTGALPGDLAFFENARDASHHVGFVHGADQVLHASGSVRIDRLDAAGIWHREKGHCTHHLLSILRVPGLGG